MSKFQENCWKEGQTLIHTRQPYLNTENTIEAAMKLYVGHTKKKT